MRHNIIDIQNIFQNKRIKTYIVAFVITFFAFLLFETGRRSCNSIPDSANKIILAGHERLSSQEISNLLKIQPGVSFDKYNLKELESKLSMHKRIKKAVITRKSKDQIYIHITERKAKYILNTGGHLYEADEDGNLISRDDVRDPELVVISGNFAIDPKTEKGTGAVLYDLLGAVSLMAKSYPAVHDRISEVTRTNEGEIVLYSHKPERMKILIGHVLNSRQIRKLYASLGYIESQNVRIKLLDLRGEDAVFH